jgi:hypothetical protein
MRHGDYNDGFINELENNYIAKHGKQRTAVWSTGVQSL